MKEKIRKWLGITAIEEDLKREINTRSDDDLDVWKYFKMDSGLASCEEPDLKAAVMWIMHHLKLGWQLEIHEAPPITNTLEETKKWVIKPYKDIKSQVIKIPYKT